MNFKKEYILKYNFSINIGYIKYKLEVDNKEIFLKKLFKCVKQQSLNIIKIKKFDGKKSGKLCQRPYAKGL